MISEGSCDTEDWSNDAEKQQFLICNDILQYYYFLCILDQINADLLSRRDFYLFVCFFVFQKHCNVSKILTGTV